MRKIKVCIKYKKKILQDLPQLIWLPADWFQLLSLSWISKCVPLGTDGTSFSSAYTLKTAATFAPFCNVHSQVI